MRNVPYGAKSITTSITETAKSQQLILKHNRQLADLTRSTKYREALHIFTKLHSLLKPDHFTLSTTLTACARLRNIPFGNTLHAYATKSGLKAYLRVSNTLLSLYANARDIASLKWVFVDIKYPDVFSYTTLLSACSKMGQVDFARRVFDEMPDRAVAVWNAMITGCIESGNEDIGFGLFRDMCRLGVRGDNYSLASVLSACYTEEEVDFGRQVHSQVIRTGFLATTSVVNALITMYFNGENVVDAFLVFEEVCDSVRDQITYNVMIDGLMSVGRIEDAYIMFKEVLWTCLRPTELTFVSLMSSCLYAGIAYQVHALAIKMGFEACTAVSNAAISMFSSCGDLCAAYMVFLRLENKDLVSWNTMISRYAQWNDGKSAIFTYLDMQKAGIQGDEFTFGSLLGSTEVIETLEMIHTLVVKNGLILNIQVSNALISAYSKHGNVEEAHHIFCDMVLKNLISWNSIISGFQLNGLPIQCLEKFSELLISELRPNEYTLSIVLSICASISALRHGKEVHGYIMTTGYASIVSLGNALISMYAKCGLLDWSIQVFNVMNERNVVSWNALISAYAQHGQGNEAVHCFKAMQHASGIKPDKTTFSAILSACSHAGLVDDGTWIFNSMVDKHGVMPGVDHFSCIVDLLGRAGYFAEVNRTISNEHFKSHSNIWWTLFSACVAHGNLKLGRLVARFLLETEQDNPSVYVLLANMYAASGQWEEAANIRHLMDNSGVVKQPGYSWISS